MKTILPRFASPDIKRLRLELAERYNRKEADKGLPTVAPNKHKLAPELFGTFYQVPIWQKFGDYLYGQFTIRVLSSAEKKSLSRIFVVTDSGRLVPVGRLTQAHNI